jgi:hypothetical protein
MQKLPGDQLRLDQLLNRQGLRHRAAGQDFEHEAFGFLPAQANLHARAGHKFRKAFRLELVGQLMEPGMGYRDIAEPAARLILRAARRRRSTHQ